ncbi:MAG: transposase [Campylobacterales bacterium]|nr:transposase [Campylobacterales bacterium]
MLNQPLFATFVDAPRQRNSKEDNADIKKGAVPLEFGYKDHINADEKTKIITKYKVTPASTHDSQVIKDLIDENDNTLYADTGIFLILLSDSIRETIVVLWL